ncbi:potassium channel family protein [Candidatus Omnitrophota bacterium]
MYVIIVGCGRVGSELAKLLSGEGHNIVVIDKSPDAFERLGDSFNGLTSVGNGFNLDLLKQVGVEKADVFCALTNGDNTNLVSAQVAKKIFKVPKVVVRVYDPQRAHIYSALGLEVISGTVLIASKVRDQIIESRFSSYLIESKELGLIEVEAKNSLVGKMVQELNMPGEFMVAAIKRLEGVTIPEPATTLQAKDMMMAVVKVSSLKKIKQKFGL